MKKYILPLLFCMFTFNSVSMDNPLAVLLDTTKEEELLDAINKSDTIAITRLINGGVNSNHQYLHLKMRTPVMIALEKKDARMLRLLLSAPGLNINLEDDAGFTALHLSATYANPINLQVLLNHKDTFVPALDLNGKYGKGVKKNTALAIATQLSLIENVKLLLAHNDLDYCDALVYIDFRYYANRLAILRLLVNRGCPIGANVIRSAEEAYPIQGLRLQLNTLKYDIDPTEDNLTSKIKSANEFNKTASLALAMCALGASLKEPILKTCFEDVNETRLDKLFKQDLLLKECFIAALQGTIPEINDNWFTANPNIQDDVYGMTPLMWAAARGNLALVEALLNFDVTCRNAYFAKQANKAPQLPQNKTFPTSTVNMCNNFGDTALHYAASNGHAGVVRLLLQHPDTISGKRNSDGKNALDLARIRNHQAVIDVFNELVANKRKPLALSLLGTIGSIKRKLPFEIIMHIAKFCPIAPLEVQLLTALQRSNISAIANLRETGMTINGIYQSLGMLSPLMWTVEQDNILLAQELHRLGVYSFIQNASGDTALHIAVRKKNLKMVQLLLSMGSGPLAMKNSRGESPVDIAIVINSIEILKLLAQRREIKKQ